MRAFPFKKSEPTTIETTASSQPLPSTDPDAGRQTIIRPDIHVTGDLTAKDKLVIEGTIEGEVRGAIVEVGEQGRITGAITADYVTVRGKVDGKITATMVQLQKTAVVNGDILHQGIGIEMGTHYDGRLQWNGERQSANAASAARPASAKPGGTARTVAAIKQSAQTSLNPNKANHIAINAEATAPKD